MFKAELSCQLIIAFCPVKTMPPTKLKFQCFNYDGTLNSKSDNNCPLTFMYLPNTDLHLTIVSLQLTVNLAQTVASDQ